MNLSDKIELLIKRKQMSSSQFADVLGIPRSSISHILSGRNKPSLDVVQKILKKSSIARLGVVPEPSICNFIKDHEI